MKVKISNIENTGLRADPEELKRQWLGQSEGHIWAEGHRANSKKTGRSTQNVAERAQRAAPSRGEKRGQARLLQTRQHASAKECREL